MSSKHREMKTKSKKQKLKEKAVELATEKKLKQHPRCILCNNMAVTAHHFIRQSQSNYLRCDERNLIPICRKCHYLWHCGGKAEVMTLQLQQMLGDKWRDELIRDSVKTIKDTIEYWEELITKL